MEKLITELNGKIKTLHFRVKKTDEILLKGDKEAAERQKLSVESISSTVTKLRENIEEKKFAKGDSEEDVQEWGNEIEECLALADENVRKLSKQIAEYIREEKDAETEREHDKLIKLEEKKLKQQREADEFARSQSLEFEKRKWELELEFKQNHHVDSPPSYASGGAAKMPKLVITKFNGTPQDWLRFWGQFEAQIDNSSVPAVTKFSYLKELVEPKVRISIDGLPFTEEGYEKAKELLSRRYGKTSEVVGTYVKNILQLPTIKERDVKKIHEFYNVLLFNVESLQTLKSLNKLDAAARFTLDKIGVIKHELAMMDEKWDEWDFLEFLKKLELWTLNNPIIEDQKNKTSSYSTPRKEKLFYSKHDTGSQQTRACLYCENPLHKAINCDKVMTVEERRKILAEKRLCFNCTGAKHRAADCKSKSTCQICEGKHHTSICKKTPAREQGMTANLLGKSAVVHPVVVVKIKGYKFRALLDTGASHSYISSTAIKLINAKPKSTSLRQISMLTGIVTRTMQVFDVVMSSVKEDFQLEVHVTKVEKRELLSLDNPHYKELIDNHTHLRGVTMDDVDVKEQLPIHLIIGANDFAKIRTGERLRVGRRGDPVAEFTRFGWTIMSPGGGTGFDNAYLAINSSNDYEQLCTLDVLGLQDLPTGNQGEVYDEFKEQLTRSSEGWYETGLPWKGNCPELPNNHDGSMRRLNTLLRKLRKTDMLDEYDSVIREQLEDGVVERAPPEVNGREFYLPHRAVIRENAESTKLRIVYDASARARDGVPSLNECLHTGPPLNNQLLNVITKQRFHPVAISGDLRKAFLQIRIRETERDSLRFHWIKDKSSCEVEVLRFTRVLFGLAPSPFLLQGVLQQHLDSLQTKYHGSVTEVRRSLYVDDLISGAPTVDKAKQFKQEAVMIFEDAKFTLHKWNSNAPELQSDKCVSNNALSFSKDQLNVLSKGECKLLGLPWDKVDDTLKVHFSNSSPAETTKRGILTKLARVYDPLGLASPVTLEGKRLYRETCVKKLAWDAPLPEEIMINWRKWERNLPDEVTIPRSIPRYQEEIEEIQLHSFGDASGYGVCATVYAVVTQASGVSQGLVSAKSRLAKEGLTIPRLELVAGHMAVNLAANVRTALEGFPVAADTHGWLDSTVALHWIHDNGDYRQFVANRVKKIQSHSEVRWHHVPTKDNPADLGSRGGSVSEQELWWKGPSWLSDPTRWPPNLVTKASPQSTAERKVQRELFMVGVEVNNNFNHALEQFGLRKALRIYTWVSRFMHNSRHPSKKIKGPLTTEEISKQEVSWIKIAQSQGMNTTKFVEDKEQLNLQLNQDDVLECRGRIQGEYPLYLPDSCIFTTEVVKHAHETTLHGGVSLTMAKVRERFWVPRLRSLVKKIVRHCYGCKRFQAVPMKEPPPGNLPKERTEGTTPFKVIGVDFAGPIKYRGENKQECKAYILLYSCCLTRGLFLDVLPTLEIEEFIKSFKRFIARRGRPSTIYSDNGTTFVAAAKWLKQVQKNERFHKFLSDQSIKWRFNVSRAPWWGGHFERLIGLMKSAFYKAVGQGLLSWDELCEIMLDVEVTLNNRPLCYMEEDVQFPTLTPNSLLFLNTNILPEVQPFHIDNRDLRKRAKFLKATKDAMWRRWTGEYLRALRERHQLKHANNKNNLAVGEVVIIKSGERNRNCWPLGIVEELYQGRDGVVRAAKLRAGRAFLDRPVQHLYPLELSCDRNITLCDAPKLNTNAAVFRPMRDAAVEAKLRIQAIAEEEENF